MFLPTLIWPLVLISCDNSFLSPVGGAVILVNYVAQNAHSLTQALFSAVSVVRLSMADIFRLQFVFYMPSVLSKCFFLKPSALVFFKYVPMRSLVVFKLSGGADGGPSGHREDHVG